MLIDSHCHLHDPAFGDVRDTLRTALAFDVYGVVAVGCDPATNIQTIVATTAAPRGVWGCLGLHPDWTHLTDEDLDIVEEQLRAHHPRIVGLGEVGLLALAARYDLAVALHAPHGAAVGAFEALKRHGIERAVFHWHKAPAEVTRAIVDAGFLVSVTPEVVYRDRDRELVEQVPIESLLVESDGPWKYAGEFAALGTSGPWLVARVAEEVAKIKRLPIEETMVQLSENTCRLFELIWA